ncbi:hypothetical protein MPAR168_10420 [Methylorubrum populi]|uniref:HTH cro/C1-type domain-containing protein n=1 Tax=Methylobacterium radiotolerans TaxID=31998 RepID=A0ABU7TG43_9HYPH
MIRSRPETPTHAGAMIRHRRNCVGMLQSELVQLIGVSGATVSRCERGRELITFERREMIADMPGLGRLCREIHIQRDSATCYASSPIMWANLWADLALRVGKSF